MNEVGRSSKNYTGYDYLEVTTDGSRASRYLDYYENFGWFADENSHGIKEGGRVLLRLKRDRKIINKAELTRLQRHLEDCLSQIELLEKSRTSKAAATAIVLGIAGTAFMAGATFAVVGETPVIWLCVILALPGFAGWILPYFLFRVMVHKREGVVTPLVEDKYDEIHEICEKGNRLTRKEA